MVPEFLRKMLGLRMSSTVTTPVETELAQRKEEAKKANLQGDVSLEEVRKIRSESREVHRQVKQTLRENHFADLMARALESR